MPLIAIAALLPHILGLGGAFGGPMLLKMLLKKLAGSSAKAVPGVAKSLATKATKPGSIAETGTFIGGMLGGEMVGGAVGSALYPHQETHNQDELAMMLSQMYPTKGDVGNSEALASMLREIETEQVPTLV